MFKQFNIGLLSKNHVEVTITTPQMFIRSATPQDASALCEIFNNYLGRATMVLEEREPNEFMALIQPVAGYRAAMLVVEASGQLLGYASVKPWSPRTGYFHAGEVSIFLSEEATGCGLGAQLYQALWKECLRLKYDHLTARIFGTNTASVRFHEQQGFELVGRQRGIGLVAGERIDSVIMEKRLVD